MFVSGGCGVETFCWRLKRCNYFEIAEKLMNDYERELIKKKKKTYHTVQ